MYVGSFWLCTPSFRACAKKCTPFQTIFYAQNVIFKTLFIFSFDKFLTLNRRFRGDVLCGSNWNHYTMYMLYRTMEVLWNVVGTKGIAFLSSNYHIYSENQISHIHHFSIFWDTRNKIFSCYRIWENLETVPLWALLIRHNSNQEIKRLKLRVNYTTLT